MTARTATTERNTRETSVKVSLDLDGSGEAQLSTGIAFLDHMFDSFTKHSRFDLTLSSKGDLEVDDHHTAEDCGIVLGQALDQALGDRTGIQRFGYAYAPLDESLARAVADISGRPFADVNLGLRREKLGKLSCENVGHVLSSLAFAAKITLHVDLLKGENDHHRAEAAFKAVALALRDAVALSDSDDIPSTKGRIERGTE